MKVKLSDKIYILIRNNETSKHKDYDLLIKKIIKLVKEEKK